MLSGPNLQVGLQTTCPGRGSLPPERPGTGALVPIPFVGSLCLPIAWWARMCLSGMQAAAGQGRRGPWGAQTTLLRCPQASGHALTPHDATSTQRRTTAPELRAHRSVWSGRPATPAPRSPEGSLHPTRGRGPCKRAMAQTVPAPCWLFLEMVFRFVFLPGFRIKRAEVEP